MFGNNNTIFICNRRSPSERLSSAGANVSSSTLRLKLSKVGRLTRKPGCKQLLTPGTKIKRVYWARKYAG